MVRTVVAAGAEVEEFVVLEKLVDTFVSIYFVGFLLGKESFVDVDLVQQF